MLCAKQREERGLGVGAGDDHPGLYTSTVRQGDTGRPGADHAYGGDLGVGADLRSGGPGRSGYRLGDATHPAADEAPTTGHAVDLAHPVVQEHIGRTGAHRSAPHADDATRGERALYSLIHEVAVEKVCATHRHQVDEPRDALPVPKSVTPEIERLRQVGKRTDAGIRRPPVEERSYEIGQLAKIMAVRQVCLAIPGVDPAYLLGRMHRVVPEQESRTVREGGEVGRVERVDVVAVPGEV